MLMKSQMMTSSFVLMDWDVFLCLIAATECTIVRMVQMNQSPSAPRPVQLTCLPALMDQNVFQGRSFVMDSVMGIVRTFHTHCHPTVTTALLTICSSVNDMVLKSVLMFVINAMARFTAMMKLMKSHQGVMAADLTSLLALMIHSAFESQMFAMGKAIVMTSHTPFFPNATTVLLTICLCVKEELLKLMFVLMLVINAMVLNNALVLLMNVYHIVLIV